MTPGADLVEALRREGVADVSASTLDRATYSSDASLYRVVPQAVVRPRHADEIAAVLSVARSAGVPLTMRGAGTSIAGNAVGPGIVVDTSKHLNRVLAVDPEARTATVQPGVVHAALQRAVAPHGLRFGPDPSTHTRCTIGGMIGNNACGSRALGYGRTADNVAGMRVLLGDGSSISTRVQGRPVGAVAALNELADGHLEHLRTAFGRFGRQVSGYSMEHLLPERGRRIDRFLVGSEGTLGLVLDATMELVPEPVATALVVLGYPSMPEAADAVPALLARPDGLTACEGLDSRIVDVVRAAGRGVPPLPRGEGWLFAEVAGDTAGEVAALAQGVVAAAGALDSRVVTDPAEAAALWRIREDGAGLAARSLRTPAYSGWEDAAVPPERLGAWLRDFDGLLRQHGLDGVPYGHFGDGCVHVRIDFGFDDGGAAFRAFLTDAAIALRTHGGSLSGEHGDGRARSELLPLMYDAESLRLFSAVKAICDPDRLLNPGVLVDPAPLDADLRPARAVAPVRTALRLVHDGGSLGNAVHRCTGVGKCLADNTGPGGVMCPSYTATRDEKDSTRGRARVLQEALDGSLVDGLADPAVGEALDLCLSCKGCARDCPTGVDMATYKSEALHQAFDGKRRPRSHYTLGRLPKWARLAAPVAPLLNASLAFAPTARLAKAVAGVDKRRDLPRFARTTLRRGTRAARGAGHPGRLAVGGHLHRPPLARLRARDHQAARGRRPDRAGHRRAGLLRADLGHHRAARQGPEDHGAHRRHAAPVRRLRGAGGRARAVLPGHPAQRRRRADRRPAGRRGGRGDADAGRAAHRPAGLDAARPDRHHRGRAAALPPRVGARLGGRRGAAGPGRCVGDAGGWLLRPGRQLRDGAGALRGVRGDRRARPAAGRPGRRSGDRGARRRAVLPGAARRPGAGPGDASGRAARL